MRNVYRITYLSGIRSNAIDLCSRRITRVDARSIDRVVESIHANLGFLGELGEWVAPSALLSIEMIGTE